MIRRDALRALLLLPIAATLDVEKLLWIPGQMVTVPKLPTLMFRRDAFSMVMAEFDRVMATLEYNSMISLAREDIRFVAGDRWS